MTAFRVVITEPAADDIDRIELFMLASATPDLDVVVRMRAAVDHALRLLSFSPYSCRRASRAIEPLERELIIPLGASGLVASLEIWVDIVYVGAIRHQLDQDFH